MREVRLQATSPISEVGQSPTSGTCIPMSVKKCKADVAFRPADVRLCPIRDIPIAGVIYIRVPRCKGKRTSDLDLADRNRIGVQADNIAHSGEGSGIALQHQRIVAGNNVVVR